MAQQPTQKPQWAQQFKIDDETWATLCSQSLRQKSTPLDVALDMGLLNENKLIHWDRHNSGVVSLSSLFFNGQPPFKLWEKYDYHWCRHQACMPVGEWEGHVYWAKLSSDPIELPQDAGSAIWVIAPWTGLKRWFGQWEAKVGAGTPEAKSSIPQEIEIPQALKTETMPEITSFTQTKSVRANLSDLMPEGLGNVTGVTNVTPPSPSFDAPMGLNLPEAAPSTSEAPVGFSELPRSGGMPPPVTPPFPMPLPAMSKPTAAPLPMPPMNPMPAGASPPPVSSVSAAAPVPMKITQPTTTNIPTLPVEQLLGRLKVAASQEELAMAVLGAWQNYFSKVMILLFQGNQLVIWRWNGLWKGQFKTGDIIPLDSPSVFKIVAETGAPYHGYVVAGPVNDRFFHQTDGGQYPEHISIVPVLVDKHVAAMLFGSCTKDMGKQLVLGRLEEHSNHFAAGLVRLLNPTQRAS